MRGGSPAKKILPPFLRKWPFLLGLSSSFFTLKSFHSVAKSCLQPAAPRRPSAIHAACCFLCSCLSFTWSLPDTAGAIGMQSAAFGSVSKAMTCICGLRRRWLLLLMRTIRVLRFRCCMCFCMLRCSMLLPAAERRPTVTPISYLEGRKCSFPLTLLLLFWRCHNQSCSAPRDMSIETLIGVGGDFFLSRGKF